MLSRDLLRLKGSIPQFHTDPLISTNRFHTRTTPFQHLKSLSSTPKTPLFHTKNPSVPHQKPLSWTHPSVPHQKLLSSTPKTLRFNTKIEPENFSVFGVELRVCWTEGFLMLNWGISGANKVWSLCWTEGICMELWGTLIKLRAMISKIIKNGPLLVAVELSFQRISDSPFSKF